jgi:CheY-like chemotaxis protein
MCVDDSPIFISRLMTFLRRHGDFAVVGIAPDGRQALEWVEKCDPQIVLVDLDMPGMDGMTTIVHLRQRQPELGIVALTLLEGRTYRRAALASGADFFVAKSEVTTELIPALSALVERTQAQAAVLVVDDNEAMANTLVNILRLKKYRATAAYDYEGAMAQLDDAALVIADIKMPDRDGVALCRAIRARRSSLPVILMTAYASPEWTERGLQSGAAAVVAKPLDIDRLLAQLDALRAAGD